MNSRVITRIDGRLGRITLHAGPLNVLGIDDILALCDAIVSCEHCSVILLDASGERAFCAGVEVSDHVPERANRMLDVFELLAKTFAAAPAPIICSVHGPAIGGGFELVLLADVALCSPKAYFSLPEVQLAAIPPIASVLLPSLIGRQRAFDTVISMRKIDAQTALAWGIVADIVEPSELARAAQDYCERVLSLSDIAVRACKRAIDVGEISRAMHLYRDVILTSSDGVEGIAAFLEKRSPVWAHSTPVGG